jgi:2-polyprenyl-3-methyl-5-hydroxy-6-metoxy-1,4-benzoquinol methylase
MDFSVRSTQPEELDEDSTDLATYQRCLTELAVINRLTLTHRPTLRWLAQAATALPAGATFSVLDVGYGDGDLLRAIARWARQQGLNVRLSGIDRNPRSAVTAQSATPADVLIDYQTGDVLSYRPTQPVDLVVSSHLTHHLSDEEVVEFLIWLEDNSRYGWHVADLQRHILAYQGFSVLATLMGWHRIIRDDGLISIARSFRRREWHAYLDKAGVPGKISWHMAFRFCVSRMK